MSARSLSALMLTMMLAPANASAWQGLCRDGNPVPRLGGLDMSMSMLSEEECAPGLAFARGAQLGEHTWLAREAMRAAGLPDEALEGYGPLTYFTLGRDIPMYTDPDERTVPSLMPAAPGSMRHLVVRPFALPEMAELADGSHTLTEWLLGNETCLPHNVPRATAAQMNACHDFGRHMGVVNTAHFAPSVVDVYRRYHRIAMGIAERCAAMRVSVDAVPAGGHAAQPQLQDALRSCEHEALVVQAYASHFMADAWSSGHMWERWGNPNFARGDETQLRAFIVAAVGGMIHGSRAVVGQHDRANLPGPIRASEDAASYTRWREGDAVQTHHGGGDTYLVPSTARSPEWAVRSGPELRRQYGRMITCMAAGFSEVYSASARIYGDLTPRSESFVAAEMPLAPEGSLSPACFNQRLTNRAMREAMGTPLPAGVRTVDVVDLARPGIMSRLVNFIVRGELGSTGVESRDLEVTNQEQTQVNRLLRIELTRIAATVIQRARRAPNDTDVARLAQPPLSRLLGFTNNGFSPRAAYLESDSPGRWTDEPLSTDRCADDRDCAQGSYCDDSTVEPMGSNQFVVRRCVPQEAALLRAFRPGELPHWCLNDTWEEMAQARESCEMLGGTTDACEGCVALLMPHVQNGCGGDPPEPMRDGVSRSAMCEVLGEPMRVVALPYPNGDTAGLAATVRRVCQGMGPRSLRSPIGQGGGGAGPYDYHAMDTRPFVAEDRTVCGASASTPHRWGFTHDEGEHTHRFRVTIADNPWHRNLGDARDVRFTMHVGGLCDEADLVGEAPAEDRDSDGVFETLELTWTTATIGFDEMCLRLVARDESTWVAFRLAAPP